MALSAALEDNERVEDTVVRNDEDTNEKIKTDNEDSLA